MRKTCLTLFILLLLFSGQVLAYPNEPTGFRGIKWGSILSQYVKPSQGYYVAVNSLEAKEHYPEKLFYNPADTLYLGDAKIQELLYYSYQKDERTPPILSKISMYFTNKPNTDALENYLTKRFGNPTKKLKPIQDKNNLGTWDIFLWEGETTTLELQILRPQQNNRCYATLWIMGTKLIDEVESKRPKQKLVQFNNGI